MAVYGYIRVSTTAQADNGESLEVQRRKIEARAQEQGWTLDQVFVERAVSGGKPLAGENLFSNHEHHFGLSLRRIRFEKIAF